MKSLVRYALENDGDIQPLIIPDKMMTPGGLFNPSVFLDNDGKLLCNIRHCQYTLFHAEKLKYEHHYGPLVYLHPEDDVTLTTTNYIATLDSSYKVDKVIRVDTSNLDVKPIWTFVGLEDARVVRWDNKLYYTGVRRDTTKNGKGRMELSEIELTPKQADEISRTRIPTPNNVDTYCEKNWMPIIDQPYRYVKWSNPTEVVEYDPENHVTNQVHIGEYVKKPTDYRGGSQVIPFGKYYIAITHNVVMHPSEAGRKNATYRHAVIIWDKNWNVVKYTKFFSFMDNLIEFCCGIAIVDDNVLISFGAQDNAAYIVKLPIDNFKKYIEEVV